jgi:error-prone DNA polymerase
MSEFVHLHCHSVWSLLDGVIPAELLPHLAAALGFEAVALTDHDALTGAVRFSKACREAGVKPIFGAELTVAPHGPGPGHRPAAAGDGAGGRGGNRRTQGRRAGSYGAAASERAIGNGAHTDRNATRRGRPGGDSGCAAHVTLLARDKTGYGNLCRLISDAHLLNERGQPMSSLDAIARRAQGLFVLSGCARGDVARAASAGRIPEAIAIARSWKDALGDGYRIEVFDHRGYGDRMLRDRLLRVAREADVPAVATNDVHYATPGAGRAWPDGGGSRLHLDGLRSDAAVHELLHAIKEIVPLSRTQALRNTSELFLKDASEMRDLFGDVPEAVDETLRIAEVCDFDLDLGAYHFPEFPIPRGFTPTRLLAARCHEGLRRRFGRVTRDIEDRLQHELGVIFKMGWAAYFLLVADIVDHVRDVMGIRCACRGSAAGSLVCYVLGISDVDPVRYDLLFERFMNSRRDELPDIDVDVESHRREEVLGYIADAYGSEQTAVCCMVDTFRARMAIREVGKALSLPVEEIDVVAKAFPHIRARDIPAALDRLPELSGSNLEAGQLDQLFELCLAIDGWPRHLALHPSGVILSSPDLVDRVPMESSFQGFTMLQADKDDAEDLGLVKLDVLGVRMLSSIAHACDEIARTHPGDGAPSLDEIPRDDTATFRLIRTSRTLGCFQIESPGQRELLARFQPSRFEDLIVDISLFRPGPVKSDMVSPFLERRHGFEEMRYVHPKLKPILTETHGVVVYHEQVIRVIAAVTGCSLDDADYVRRHLGEADVDDVRVDGVKSSEPEGGLAGWFIDSATANGFTEEEATKLWREVVAFASFGFCKSHAAAFALPTYVSAWLKAHYPAEFFAGVLTHDPGMYPRRLIVGDARHFGIRILPIDVNASDKVYRAEPVAGASGNNGIASGNAAGAALPAPVSPAPDAVSESRPQTRDGLAPAGEARLGEWGVRLALSEVRGISEAEIDSILTARRDGLFSSLEDLWRRTELSRPVLENLVHVGALDSLRGVRGDSSRGSERGTVAEGGARSTRGGAMVPREQKGVRGDSSRGSERGTVAEGGARSTRGMAPGTDAVCRGKRELLWRAAELASEVKPRAGAQMTLGLDDSDHESLSGLPDYTSLEETEAELEISGIDARRHVMDLYRPLAAEIGCASAIALRNRRNDSEVWVAGVKVASQTPAIRSGQRIIFVTIDELAGPIDVTVFARVQPRCARTVFHSWLLLVKGVVRKRGGASFLHDTDATNVGITVVAQEVFDLAEVAADRKEGHSLAAALGRQRRKQTQATFGAPAGDLHPPRSLWHSSGGSAGR